MEGENGDTYSHAQAQFDSILAFNSITSHKFDNPNHASQAGSYSDSWDDDLFDTTIEYASLHYKFRPLNIGSE